MLVATAARPQAIERVLIEFLSTPHNQFLVRVFAVRQHPQRWRLAYESVQPHIHSRDAIRMPRRVLYERNSLAKETAQPTWGMAEQFGYMRREAGSDRSHCHWNRRKTQRKITRETTREGHFFHTGQHGRWHRAIRRIRLKRRVPRGSTTSGLLLRRLRPDCAHQDASSISTAA
jgi:hypothetical protein